MKNGWTGGQYSVFRVLLGCYIFGQLIGIATSIIRQVVNPLIPAPTPPDLLVEIYPNLLDLFPSHWFAFFTADAAGIAVILLTIGWRSRPAALALLYLTGCFVTAGYLPLATNSVFLSTLLGIHLLIPPAPYGSRAAARRPDPAGKWRLPFLLPQLIWIALALYYFFGGINSMLNTAVFSRPLTWLPDAVRLYLAVMALLPAQRFRTWLLMAIFQLLTGITGSPAFAGIAGCLFHLLALDPDWIPPHPLKARRAVVFYDGHCGLCHRSVRFILAEDQRGIFKFAPLQHPVYAGAIPAEKRNTLPDSIVLYRRGGELLVESEAVIYVLNALGRFWRIVGLVAGCIPTPLLNRVYRSIAAIRHRWFKQPDDLCPILPSHLQKRFLV